jgi:hypothetical protein
MVQARVVPAVVRRLRRGDRWAWASLGLIAIEGLVTLLFGPQPFLAALLLLVAPGLALVAFMPAALRAPVVRFAIVPIIGTAASSVVIIGASSAGVPITGLNVRLLLLAVTLGSLTAQLVVGPCNAAVARPRDRFDELVGLLLLGAVVCLGVTLQALIVGSAPVPGQDWGHYLLYTDEIRQKHSLLIENPYWMLGGRFFSEDPGAPSLYAGYALVSGQPTAVLAQGIWVFAALAVVSVFTFVATLWGRTAGLIAAGLYAVIPMNLDMLAWHGLANVYALVLLPLVLLAAGTALRGGAGPRWSFVLALGLVALAAAHRLSFLVAVLTLLLCLGVALWLRFGSTVRFALLTIAMATLLGAGVAVDLVRRNRAGGGLQDYRVYLPTKVSWDSVTRDLTTLLVVLAVLALGALLVARPLRADSGRWVVFALLIAIAAFGYAWIAHVPTAYYRATYYLPLVLVTAIGIAWSRLFRNFTFAAIGVIVIVAVQAYRLAPELRTFFGDANRTTLAGFDLVNARAGPGDAVVTDPCWGFLSTWLLHRPTLAAEDPALILPRWEVEPSRLAGRILAGGEAGRSLARRLHVRFALVDPRCTFQTGQAVPSPAVGKRIFTSRRLVVYDLGATPSDRSSPTPTTGAQLADVTSHGLSAAAGPSRRAGVSSPANQRVPGIVVGLVLSVILGALALGLVAVRRSVSPWAMSAPGTGFDRRSPSRPAVRTAAVVGITGVFALMAVEAVRQVQRLIWRPAEIGRMLEAAYSLAGDFPGRFTVLVALSVGLMLLAEYRPRALLDGSTVVWIGVGWIGVGAYVLGLLDLGSRGALAVVLLVGTVATAAAVVRIRRAEPAAEQRSNGTPWSATRRAVLPLAVGLTGGVLAARAMIEPVTQWDAIVTHVSFARDWLQSLPGLPHAAGPSGGAEVSYNYPALFPSIAVAIAAPLHLAVADVARVISPLAAVTLLAALRVVGSRSGFAGWAPSMFVLGSTLFVAYAQWPSAYMLMALMLVLAVGRLYVDRSLRSASAALIGLAAGTALIGLFFATILVGVCIGLARRHRPKPRPTPIVPLVFVWLRDNAPLVALLTAPIAVVSLASLYYTRGLFFPWLSWPRGGHLLPQPEWNSTHDLLTANPYGHPDADLGDFAGAVRRLATANALAPGGIVLAGLAAAACLVATPFRHRGLRAGVALAIAASLLLVSMSLVRFGYFLPVIIVAAVGMGAGLSALKIDNSLGKQPLFRIQAVALTTAAAAAVASLAAGAVYAIAGPNDRVPTAATSYRNEEASAFEQASSAANSNSRLEVVFGDDARAWTDIRALDARAIEVGTFDVRSYYSAYRPSLQLDGLAGASIRGTSASAVAARLKGRGIDAVFVPSTFWHSGQAGNRLADLSPVALWVGSPVLRAVRVYLPNEDVNDPSVLYAVGDQSARRIDSILQTPALSIAGSLSSWKVGQRGGFAFGGTVGDGSHWRVSAPVTEDRGPVVRFTTRASGSATDVTISEPRTPTLFEDVAFVDCSGAPGWARVSTLDVVLPGSPLGFAVLDIGGRPDRKERFSGGVALRKAHVLVRACGDPTGAPGGVFPANNLSSRITASPPASGRLLLSFDYLDQGRGSVSFGEYDDLHDSWRDRALTLERCGSGRWLHATLPVPRLSRMITEIRLAPVVAGQDFAVRDLRLESKAPVHVPRCQAERPDTSNLLARRSLAARSSAPGNQRLANAR